MDYKIRLIEPKDNRQIEEIILGVSEEYGTYNPKSKSGAGAGAGDPELKDIYSTYNNKGSKYWVIEDEASKVVGGGGYTRLKGTIEDENICEMQKLFIIPEARGKNLGKKLVELFLSEAAKDRYKEMYLETVKQMKEATRLYEKYGFKHLTGPKGSTGHFQCSVFMTKELNNI